MNYVNHEAIRALSDKELSRALREDSMPTEQWVAMLKELDRRITPPWKKDARP